MTTLHTIVLVFHVLIGAMIVALVLLQRGKGADAGAGFGAGASGTVFGAAGSANFLSRSTAVLAMLFFGTSLGLTYLGTQRKAPESLLDTAEPAPVQVQVPAGTATGGGPSPGVAPVELPALPTAPPQSPSSPPDKAGSDQPTGKTAGRTGG